MTGMSMSTREIAGQGVVVFLPSAGPILRISAMILSQSDSHGVKDVF
jgi:hypothetical protein